MFGNHSIQKRYIKLHPVLLLLLSILNACAPVKVPDSAAAPSIIKVLYSPSLNYLAARLNTCTTSLPGTALLLHETPTIPQSINPGEILLSIIPNPKTPYLYEIGSDELVVAVHPSNPISTLSAAGLKALYSGSLRSWREITPDWCANCRPDQLPSTPPEPWGYPAGFELQSIFEPPFGITIQPNRVYIAPSPSAMLAALSHAPSAIGFLPRHWVDSTVKSVSIQSLPAVRFPILAGTTSEPVGIVREFLLCLQNK